MQLLETQNFLRDFNEVGIDHVCDSSSLGMISSSCFAEYEPNNGREFVCFKSKVNLDNDIPIIEEMPCSTELPYLCSQEPKGTIW